MSQPIPPPDPASDQPASDQPASDQPAADQPAADQPASDQIGEDTQYCRRVLLNLIEMGTELAAMAVAQARSQQQDPAGAQKSMAAFNSVAQSVRRTVMLHDKLGKPAKSPANRIAARKKIIRDVEDVIQRKADDPDHEKALHAELLERLDRPELEDEIADRPIDEIVTEICRDLGIAHLPGAHPWRRRLPHDIAILNARAAQLCGEAPSAELAALIASAPPPPPKRITPMSGADPAEEVAHIIETVWRDRWESGG